MKTFLIILLLTNTLTSCRDQRSPKTTQQEREKLRQSAPVHDVESQPACLPDWMESNHRYRYRTKEGVWEEAIRFEQDNGVCTVWEVEAPAGQ